MADAELHTFLYHCEKCQPSSMTDPPSIGVCARMVCAIHGKAWHWPEDWRAVWAQQRARSPRICALCLEEIPRDEYEEHLQAHGVESLTATRRVPLS